VVVLHGDFLRVYPAPTWPAQQALIRDHHDRETADRIIAGAYSTTVQDNGRIQLKHDEYRHADSGENRMRITGMRACIRVDRLRPGDEALPGDVKVRDIGHVDDLADRRRGRGRPVSPGHIVEIALSEIAPTSAAERLRTDLDVRDLARSLREEGQQFPIYVRGPLPYRVIAGHRRVAALRAIGTPTVRAIVLPKIGDAEAQRLALIDNLDHSALSDADLVRAVRRLRDLGLRNEEIATLLKRKVRTVQRHLRLAEAPREIFDEIDQGRLTVSAAYEVFTRGIPVDRAIRRGRDARSPSVRALQEWGRAAVGTDVPGGLTRRAPQGGTPVRLRRYRDGGIGLSLRVPRDIPDDDRREVVRVLSETLAQIEGPIEKSF
jgi:ParB/RepB/Spo0J family partition protein